MARDDIVVAVLVLCACLLMFQQMYTQVPMSQQPVFNMAPQQFQQQKITPPKVAPVPAASLPVYNSSASEAITLTKRGQGNTFKTEFTVDRPVRRLEVKNVNFLTSSPITQHQTNLKFKYGGLQVQTPIEIVFRPRTNIANVDITQQAVDAANLDFEEALYYTYGALNVTLPVEDSPFLNYDAFSGHVSFCYLPTLLYQIYNKGELLFSDGLNTFTDTLVQNQGTSNAFLARTIHTHASLMALGLTDTHISELLVHQYIRGYYAHEISPLDSTGAKILGLPLDLNYTDLSLDMHEGNAFNGATVTTTVNHGVPIGTRLWGRILVSSIPADVRRFTLTGTLSFYESAATVVGLNTKFTTELYEGMTLTYRCIGGDPAVEYNITVTVDSITSNTQLLLTAIINENEGAADVEAQGDIPACTLYSSMENKLSVYGIPETMKNTGQIRGLRLINTILGTTCIRDVAGQESTLKFSCKDNQDLLGGKYTVSGSDILYVANTKPHSLESGASNVPSGNGITFANALVPHVKHTINLKCTDTYGPIDPGDIDINCVALYSP
tara:strand:+ start:10106 stop:11767 length:1662 start_codon:yes stop_codon:yes gene_type:complete